MILRFPTPNKTADVASQPPATRGGGGVWVFGWVRRRSQAGLGQGRGGGGATVRPVWVGGGGGATCGVHGLGPGGATRRAPEPFPPVAVRHGLRRKDVRRRMAREGTLVVEAARFGPIRSDLEPSPLPVALCTSAGSTGSQGAARSHQIHMAVGVRQITSAVDPRTEGRIFAVNGQRLFLLGGNWIATDQLLRHTTDRARYLHEVCSVAEYCVYCVSTAPSPVHSVSPARPQSFPSKRTSGGAQAPGNLRVVERQSDAVCRGKRRLYIKGCLHGRTSAGRQVRTSTGRRGHHSPWRAGHAVVMKHLLVHSLALCPCETCASLYLRTNGRVW